MHHTPIRPNVTGARRLGRAVNLRRTVAAGLGLALAGAALVSPGATPAWAGACVALLDYSTPGSYCFRVPDGVQKVTFDVSGAQGGQGGPNGAHGGLGGQVISEVAVTSGQTFNITVGGAGADGSVAHGGGSDWAAGGSNGGGRGGGSNGTETSTGGGGGGASDIRNADGTRIIVAGGGGGGGGYGGWDPILDNTTVSYGGAGGGEAYTLMRAGAGAPQSPTYQNGKGGGGAASWAGGEDGNPYGQAGAVNGNDGQCIYTGCIGGGAVFHTGGGGGGGGGGLYGGGGGQAGTGTWGNGDGGGGGGGSNWAPRGATFPQDGNSGNGHVRISWKTTVTLTSSASPSDFYQPPTFVAQVVGASNHGSVTFTMDGNPICSQVPLLVNGTATCAPLPDSAWHTGTHTVQATYSGAPNSPAAVLSQVIRGRTDLSLKIAEFGDRTNDVPTGADQDITLVASAYVTGAPAQQPLGAVTFYNGTTVLATVPSTATADNQSRATYRLRPPSGANQFRAVYTATATTGPASATLNHTTHAGVTMLTDSSNTLTYHGTGWGYYPNRPFGDYDNDVHATTFVLDYVEVDAAKTAGNSRVSIYGERDPYQGTIGIYYGQQLLGTVDTSGPISNQPRQLIWSGLLPTGSSQPLRVANLSHGSWFTIDLITLDPNP